MSNANSNSTTANSNSANAEIIQLNTRFMKEMVTIQRRRTNFLQDQIEELKRENKHLKESAKKNHEKMVEAFKFLENRLNRTLLMQDYNNKCLERRIRELENPDNESIPSTFAELPQEESEDGDSISDYNTEDERNDESDESEAEKESEDEDSSSDYNTEDEQNDECDSEEEEEDEVSTANVRVITKVNLVIGYDGDSSSDYDSEDEEMDSRY